MIKSIILKIDKETKNDGWKSATIVKSSRRRGRGCLTDELLD